MRKLFLTLALALMPIVGAAQTVAPQGTLTTQPGWFWIKPPTIDQNEFALCVWGGLSLSHTLACDRPIIDTQGNIFGTQLVAGAWGAVASITSYSPAQVLTLNTAGTANIAFHDDRARVEEDGTIVGKYLWTGLGAQAAVVSYDSNEELWLQTNGTASVVFHAGETLVEEDGDVVARALQVGHSGVAAVSSYDTDEALLLFTTGTANIEFHGSSNFIDEAGSLTITGNLIAPGVFLNNWLDPAGGDTHVCTDGTAGGGDGYLYICSSSQRFKKDITDLSVDRSKLFQLRPVSFKWKANGNPGVGLIAEEVAALGLDDLVFKNVKGEVQGIHYEKLAIYLLPIVKDQQARIEALERAVDALQHQGGGQIK